MKTRELQTLWWDWLGTSERLLRSLHEQMAAVTLRELARVERIQPELDVMLERVKTLDETAMACVHRLAEELGCEPRLRSMMQVLDKAEAQQLQGLANRVTVAARNLQDVLKRNRALLENELTYVNGSLTLIAKAAVEERGRFGIKAGTAVLVDQAA
jgi:hypothetical protein